MPGDIEVEDAPTVVADDKKAVKKVKVKGGNGEEVHGRDGFAMITKKCPPSLGRFRISGCPAHPARDGAFGNLKAEHAEFAMNARSTPGGVLGHHLENQIPNFSRNLLAASSPAHFAKEGPIQAESSLVPAGHSVRSDQIEALLPVGPELAQGNPKQFVEQTQSGFRMPAFQDEELLAKSEVLQHQVLARTKEAKGGSEPDPEKFEHSGKVIADRILIRAFMSLISQSDGIVVSGR